MTNSPFSWKLALRGSILALACVTLSIIVSCGRKGPQSTNPQSVPSDRARGTIPNQGLPPLGDLSFSDRTQTPVRGQSQTIVSQDGGADPSGGNGTSSNQEKVQAALKYAFTELPIVLHRISFWLTEHSTSDPRGNQYEIAFIKDCFEKSPSSCTGNLFDVLKQIQLQFENSPNYQDDACDSSNHQRQASAEEDNNDHNQHADMSITKNLELCVSYRLIRYPESSLFHETLALLAHELVHGLGFAEKEAEALQNWILERDSITDINKNEVGQFSRSLNELSFKNALVASYGLTVEEDRNAFCVANQNLIDELDEFLLQFQSADRRIFSLPREFDYREINTEYMEITQTHQDYCLSESPNSVPTNTFSYYLSLDVKLTAIAEEIKHYVHGGPSINHPGSWLGVWHLIHPLIQGNRQNHPGPTSPLTCRVLNDNQVINEHQLTTNLTTPGLLLNMTRFSHINSNQLGLELLPKEEATGSKPRVEFKFIRLHGNGPIGVWLKLTELGEHYTSENLNWESGQRVSIGSNEAAGLILNDIELISISLDLSQANGSETKVTIQCGVSNSN